MSDKYEDAAREWWTHYYGTTVEDANNRTMRMFNYEEIADAFHWYAAKLEAERRKEECWQTNKPEKSGYYLAAWPGGTRVKGLEKGLAGEIITEPRIIVSELWYSESNGWWTARGYIDGNNRAMHIESVVAWRKMPIYEEASK